MAQITTNYFVFKQYAISIYIIHARVHRCIKAFCFITVAIVGATIFRSKYLEKVKIKIITEFIASNIEATSIA